jgi:catechol 2,3-dioxygenase-like lactoylglutathione lyase family enzyme
MSLRIYGTVLNTVDLSRAAVFWIGALDARPRKDADVTVVDGEVRGLADDVDWLTLDLPGGGHLALQAGRVQPVDRDQPIHLDIEASESRPAEVARVVALGAVEQTDWPYPDDADYTVLRDPDGHLFCIVDPVQV